MRTTFVNKIEELAKDNPNIQILTADLGRFFNSFREKYPNNFINCGVAEENMIGVAAGLALSGRKVYCYSIVPFLVMRALESIRVNICLDKLPIVLMGGGGGLLYGKDGVTHQSIEDISIMRSLPGMTVVAPGDLAEVKALAKESINYAGPLYIRFGRDNAPQIHKEQIDFKIGKGIVLNKGKDIALLVAGSLLYEAEQVRKLLFDKGINITLVSMHTIKPIDAELIKELAESHKNIFTLEDHSIIGGLGSAVQDILNDIEYGGRFKKLGLSDEYSKYVGDTDYLYKCYGLDVRSIVSQIQLVS
jgi:transketolase